MDHLLPVYEVCVVDSSPFFHRRTRLTLLFGKFPYHDAFILTFSIDLQNIVAVFYNVVVVVIFISVHL